MNDQPYIAKWEDYALTLWVPFTSEEWRTEAGVLALVKAHGRNKDDVRDVLITPSPWENPQMVIIEAYWQPPVQEQFQLKANGVQYAGPLREFVKP